MGMTSPIGSNEGIRLRWGNRTCHEREDRPARQQGIAPELPRRATPFRGNSPRCRRPVRCSPSSHAVSLRTPAKTHSAGSPFQRNVPPSSPSSLRPAVRRARRRGRPNRRESGRCSPRPAGDPAGRTSAGPSSRCGRRTRSVRVFRSDGGEWINIPSVYTRRLRSHILLNRCVLPGRKRRGRSCLGVRGWGGGKLGLTHGHGREKPLR